MTDGMVEREMISKWEKFLSDPIRSRASKWDIDKCYCLEPEPRIYVEYMSNYIGVGYI